MSAVVEHVRALVHLASVLGAESNLLQPHVSRILQLTLRAQDLTLEKSQEASTLLRDANLADSVKQRLRTAMEERLRLPTAGKAPRQNWCSLPLYLPAPLLRTLANEEAMYVKLDVLMQWLLSCGLRSPSEPTLGVVTVLVNLQQKPSLLHPQTAFELFLKCKARARTYLDRAAPWTSDLVQELPADPRLLPCPNVFHTVAPTQIIMPPIFSDFLMLVNSLPLRSNHALLQKGSAGKTARNYVSVPAAAPLALPAAPPLAVPNPPEQQLALALPGLPSQEFARCLSAASLSTELPPSPTETVSSQTAPTEAASDSPEEEVPIAADPEAASKQADTTPATLLKKRSLLDCVEELKKARKQLKTGESTAKVANVAKEETAPLTRCRQKTAPSTPKPKKEPAAGKAKAAAAAPKTLKTSKEQDDKGKAAKEKAALAPSKQADAKTAAADSFPVERIYVVYAKTKSYLVALSGGKKRLLVCVEEKMSSKHADWIGRLHEQGNKKLGEKHEEVKSFLLDGRARLLARARKP